MQNRLATAVIMAVGRSLAILEENNEISCSASGKLLDGIQENIIRLLKGETIPAEAGYPDLKLSGNNLAFSLYSDTLRRYVDEAEGFSPEVQGYKE